jgi:nicotinate-nucleotide adenylyltransferase
MNIGVLGGTFDPVHLGHLAIAEQARTQLKLAEVIFVPAGNPYFKVDSVISPSAQRVDMLRLAIGEIPYLKISLIEIERPVPSYTVDTLATLKDRLQQDDELFLILGWDSFLTLPLWHQPERLMGLCRFVAAPRPGYSRPDTQILEKKLPGISERSVVMDRPMIEISSTQIRERVDRGLYIGDLVPEKVAKYIRDNGLYQRNSVLGYQISSDAQNHRMP